MTGWQWHQLDHSHMHLALTDNHTSTSPLSFYRRQEGHPACKKWEKGGGRHWLVRMEWHETRWSVCLPLLIFACTIKSRSSLLALAHLGGPRKRAVKWLWLLVTKKSHKCRVVSQTCSYNAQDRMFPLHKHNTSSHLLHKHDGEFQKLHKSIPKPHS